MDIKGTDGRFRWMIMRIATMPYSTATAAVWSEQVGAGLGNSEATRIALALRAGRRSERVKRKRITRRCEEDGKTSLAAQALLINREGLEPIPGVW